MIGSATHAEETVQHRVIDWTSRTSNVSHFFLSGRVDAGSIHTGQWLSSAGGGRGRHARVLQVAELIAGLGGLGLDAVHNGTYRKQALDIVSRNCFCAPGVAPSTLGHHIAEA